MEKEKLLKRRKIIELKKQMIKLQEEILDMEENK